MHLSIKSRGSRLRRLAAAAILVFLFVTDARALSTGLPLRFEIDPATIRQGENEETNVVASVVLKTPSPTVFVCEVRSSNKNKITFTDIIFKKGQIENTTQGTVYWNRVPGDCQVRISTFSADAPGEKLWFTVTLKTKDLSESEDNG